MSQTVITQAFEALKAQEAANGGVLTLDEFVFASVPNLNITDPIDRTEGLPPAAQIVHRQAVSKTGMVNSNAVVYSVVMGADVGDFEFNWVGLLNKASGVVAMIVHAPSQKKIKTASGQQGNVLTRSFLMEYNGASQQTQIITPADTWQIDFTARLNGVDERVRIENIDTYDMASFLGDGFSVSKSGAKYAVKKGVAYIAGLRAELLFDQDMTVSTRPSKIWLDVCWAGTMTSVWAAQTKLTVADDLADYTDDDEKHYVYAIAEILSDGTVKDLRPVSAVEQLVKLNYEQNTFPYFDENKKLDVSPISDLSRDILKQETASAIQAGIGLHDIDGVNKYPELQMARWRDEGDVRGWGVKMDGTADDTDSLNLCLSESRVVRFPSQLNGPCIISGTLLIRDDTEIYGPGEGIAVIKCAPTMDPASHALATYNYANGIATANKNIHIEGLCVDGNGYLRAPGNDKPAGCNFVINAEDSKIKKCRGVNAPLWNLFVTSGNPFEDAGHNGAIKAPSKRVVVDGFTSVDPVHGDGAIIQGAWDSAINNFTSLYTSTLAASGLKVRTDAGIQLVEGCRGVSVHGVVADHAKTVTTAVGISCHVNKPYMSDIVVDGVQARGLSTCVGVFNDPAVVPVGSAGWRNRRFSIRNVHIQNPVLDAASTVMQSRLVDVQNAMGVTVENVSVSFLDEAGSYSAPTCAINFAGVHDFSLSKVEFKDVPDIGAASYQVNKARGWIHINDANCKRGTVNGIHSDNIGYLNRMVSDTLSNCILSIKNVVIDAVPVGDAGSKEVIVCSSPTLNVDGIVIPAGMTVGRLGGTLIALGKNNTDVRTLEPRVFYGGLHIRAYNNGAEQTMPGILFDRTYVSGSNTTGKGSVAFSTSAEAQGAWSVAAWDEDTKSAVPILVVSYKASDTIKKYIAPVLDGDTNNGNASARWLNVHSVNGVITLSDATKKTGLRDSTIAENIAFGRIARLPDLWKWIRRVEEEGSGARWHSGPTVQEAIEIMTEHGLDWREYSCFCYDYQPYEPERRVVVPARVDEESGMVISPQHELIIPAVEESESYGFRKEELLWRCMKAQANQLDSIEKRLSDIESA